MLHPATPCYMLHATDVMTAMTHMISATSALAPSISMCCHHTIATGFHHPYMVLPTYFIVSRHHTEPKLAMSYGELTVAQPLGTIQVAIKTSPAGWLAIGLRPMMETCHYRFMSGLFRPDKRNTNFLFLICYIQLLQIRVFKLSRLKATARSV